VPVTTSLLSKDGRDAFVAAHRAEYEKIRKLHSAPNFKLVSLEAARAKRAAFDWGREKPSKPEFTGVRVLRDFPLGTLREFIDWTPFFRTWQLKGSYPRILEDDKLGE